MSLARASFPPAVSVAGDRATEAASPSPGDFSGLSALLAGRKCDPMAYRRIYRGRWPEFLRSHFASADHVQVFFSVDNRTARNWWEGTTGPQGWASDYARLHFPEQLGRVV